MSEPQYVSFKPSEAKSGTGLLDDVDVKVKEARWVSFDWARKDGTKSEPSLALCLTLTHAGGEATEYLSGGAIQHFAPSPDGKRIAKVGEKTALYKSCNAMVFLESLVMAGYPENRLESIDALDGLAIHVVRKAQAVREFRNGQKTKEGAMVLTVSKILGLNRGATTGTPSPNGHAELTAQAIEAVKKIAQAHSGQIQVGSIPALVWGTLPEGQRNQVLPLLVPEFYAKGPWIYDAQAGLILVKA